MSRISSSDLKRWVRREAGRVDEDGSLHRSASKIHRTGVRQQDRVGILIRPNANHKVFAGDTTAHVPAHHEREASEHLLFGDASLMLKQSTQPLD